MEFQQLDKEINEVIIRVSDDLTAERADALLAELRDQAGGR
jgi:hypothetical protein